MEYTGWYLFIPVRVYYGLDMKPQIEARIWGTGLILWPMIAIFERFASKHPILITGEK